VDGSIHAVACPNGHAFVLDAPLLLFRPGELPPLVFSPPQQTTAEQEPDIALAARPELAVRLQAALREAEGRVKSKSARWNFSRVYKMLAAPCD
jgi:hypothetical protein